MIEVKQRWRVDLEDKVTKERWSEEIVVRTPMAQVSAEVSAIKAANEKRGENRVRCTFSRFIEEVR